MWKANYSVSLLLWYVEGRAFGVSSSQYCTALLHNLHNCEFLKVIAKYKLSKLPTWDLKVLFFFSCAGQLS